MIEIIDNFLPEEDFKKLQEFVLSSYFPWYKNDFKSSMEYQGSPENYNYDIQMKHTFHNGVVPASEHFVLLEPLFSVLNPLSILRTKANLTLATANVIKYGFHMDYDDPRVISGVLYLNTNDGKTVFKSGEEAESVANRMVRFTANQMHTGTSHTNTKYRALINFNYIPK
jgi:hypothetical protein